MGLSYLPHIYQRNQPRWVRVTSIPYILWKFHSVYLHGSQSQSTIHGGKYTRPMDPPMGINSQGLPRKKNASMHRFNEQWPPRSFFWRLFWGGVFLFFLCIFFMISPTRKARHLESFFETIPHFLKIWSYLILFMNHQRHNILDIFTYSYSGKSCKKRKNPKHCLFQWLFSSCIFTGVFNGDHLNPPPGSFAELWPRCQTKNQGPGRAGGWVFPGGWIWSVKKKENGSR